ncbi:MAG: GntR family transcriptional regulator [Chloroflexota bacterium]
MPAAEVASPTVSLPEQAYRAVRAMILDLRLLPGEKLVLRELAERLRMSRTPVREALVRLSSEGLVETLPHRGMRVAAPTAVVTREIYQVVAGIEGQAAKLAAENASPELVAGLDAAAARLEALAAARDLSAWPETDRVFHDLLLEASGNAHMRELMRRFDGHLHRIRMATVYQGRMPYESVRDHRALVEAIKARDGQRARALHLAHRDRAFAEHERIVEEMLTVFYHVSTRLHEERLIGAGDPGAGPGHY